MPRDSRIYLEDIAEAAERIRDYTSGLAFDGFKQDRKTVDAVIRDLEIIGEACEKTPDDIRQLHEEVE